MIENNKDFEIANERLYTSFETARICNISRTTLLRIEENGIETPRHIEESSGNRYYDVVNIHRIMQYQMFHRLGLTNKDIASYYNGELDNQYFLAVLRERLAIAQRCVDEFEARFTERESLTYSFEMMPGGLYYCFPCDIENPKEQIEYNYLEIQKMYDMGFKPSPTTPMVSVVPDVDSVYEGKASGPFHSMICVAVSPDSIPDESKVFRSRQRQGFSLLYHGNDDEIMNIGGELLYEEMQKRGLKACGPLIGVCLAGPFFGTRLDPRDYLFRWVIPVE